MGKQLVRLGSVALLFSALAAPAWAGFDRWTPYGPPEGFLVTAVADQGRLFAASDESGVYTSADRGLTWSWSGVGMASERVEALAVDPDDHVLYAAGQRRFFESDDAGAHWTALAPLPAQTDPVNDVLALAPGEPDIFFLSIGKNLYRGTDGGRTWTPVLSAQTQILSILVDPNDADSVFVGTAEPGQLLHSADGGDTWAPVTDVQVFPDLPSGVTPFSPGVVELTAAASHPSTLFAVSNFRMYRSEDAGASWREIRVIPAASGLTESLVATPGDHSRLYTLQLHLDDPFTDGFYVSDDLGDTWIRITDTARRAAHLRVDLSTGDLFGLDISGLTVTEDEGATWQLSPLGNQACGLPSFPRVAPKLRFAAKRTYAAVGGRLWVSRNNGRSWSVLGRDLIDQCIAIVDVAVDPQPNVLWAAMYNGVYRSNNGGTTWTRSLGPLRIADGALRFQGITMLDARTLLFSGYGIWRSDNHGATWKRTLSGDALHDEFDEPVFARAVYRIRAEPGNPKVVYAGLFERGERHPLQTLPYVYQSLDGGRTWKRIGDGGYVIAVHPLFPKTIYVSSHGDLLVSRDRGRHFLKVGEIDLGVGFSFIPAGSDLEGEPHHAAVLYAASGDGPEFGVFRSPSGGRTWEPLKEGLDGLPAFEIFLDPQRVGHLFAASEGLYEGLFLLPE